MAIRSADDAAMFRFAVGELGADELRVLRFEAHEGLSRLFALELELLSEDPAVDFEVVVGQNAAFAIERGDEPRFLNGIVTSFEQGAIGRRFTRYYARVEPRVWRLGQRIDSRIFQQQSVPEIVTSVLERAGIPSDTFDLRLQADYPLLEYCVQYQESDWDFLSRLLEEAGIFYFFEHDAEEHHLVLGDAASVHRPIPGPVVVPFRPESTGASDGEHLCHFRRGQGIRPGLMSLRDYSFQQPRLGLDAGHRAEDDESLEVYEYPAGHRSSESGNRLARIRLAEQRADRCSAQARGDCHRMIAGHRFELSEHGREDWNRGYLLTEVEQRGHQPQSFEQEAAGSGEEPEYELRLRCIPDEVEYRPPRRTPRPRIRGTQSATVVGPPGEEIYTDELGRVKVRFHWDRQHEADDTASCFVRVSQQWAGSGYGFFSLPRVGHEVVVAFFEGDPSRPHIIGSVYNADNEHPYALPDQKTKSGIRTASTAGGEGWNEIRFEDERDREQIFIHAQRQLDLRIGRDRYETVGNEHHLVVGKDRFEHVGADRHLKVDADAFEELGGDAHRRIAGKQSTEVKGSRSLKVAGDVVEVFESAHSQEVGADYFLKAAGVVLESSSSGLTLKCGDSAIVIDHGGITLKGPLITLDGELVKLASGPGSAAASGRAGTLVSPSAPQAAFDADEADPGAVAAARAAQAERGEGKYGAVPIRPFEPDAAETAPEERSWIEIELVDEAGDAVPGERYELLLPDGARVARGTLDESGRARVEGVPAGDCRVRFPALDEAAWEPA